MFHSFPRPRVAEASLKRCPFHSQKRRPGAARTWIGVLAAIVLAAATTGGVLAGTVEEDWKAVTDLDAGPTGKPDTNAAVGAMVVGHLAKQEKALRSFLSAHPDDAHGFEAQLRLARLLQIRAEFENSEKMRVESKRILDSLEKTATPEQRPELEFAKIARLMRALKKGDAGQRADLLQSARRFTSAYPDDRRVGELLAEVATLFDAQPKLKQTLLEDAQTYAKDPDLKARIDDDLKRVRMLGNELTLSFTSVQGQEISIAGFAGRPVFVIYFAQNSPPAMVALAKLQQEVAKLPQGSIRVIGVSLDGKRETVLELLKTRGLTWPVAWDGKGWESPFARDFGINALPTVWLVDSHGKLRFLNALEGAAERARELMREK